MADSSSKRSRISLACVRCRDRKTKCDRRFPSCSTCEKLGVECRNPLTASADHTAARSFVESLEAEIETLEIRASGMVAGSSSEQLLVPPRLESCHQSTSTSASTSASTRDSSTTTATSRDLNLNPLGEIEMTTTYDQGTYTLTTMVREALLAGSKGAHAKAAPSAMADTVFRSSSQISCFPPDSAELQGLCLSTYVENYFGHVHKSFPFLDEEEVRRVIDSIHQRKRVRASEKAIVYMVLAIGAIFPAVHSYMDTFHSVRFFSCAIKELDVYKETPATIQIVLLYTLFSLMEPSAGDTWQLIDLCTRSCIKLGFHRGHTLRERNAFRGESSNKNMAIFWSTYVLDRWISCALDLPFGIQNLEITIRAHDEIQKLPQDVIAGPEFGFLCSWCHRLSAIQQPGSISEADAVGLTELRHSLSTLDSDDSYKKQGELLPKLVLYQILITSLIFQEPAQLQTEETKNLILKDYTTLADNILGMNYTFPWLMGYTSFQAAMGVMAQVRIMPNYRILMYGPQILEILSCANRLLRFSSARMCCLEKLYDIVKYAEECIKQGMPLSGGIPNNLVPLRGTRLLERCSLAFSASGIP